MCFSYPRTACTDTNCIDIYWYRNISPNLYCAIWTVKKILVPWKIGLGTNFFTEYWSFTENFGPGEDQFCMKKLVPGPIFHEKLVHCRTKIFSLGPIFRKNFGPGEQNSMEIGPKPKILLKITANSAKLSAFSDSVPPIYPKNDLKSRAF